MTLCTRRCPGSPTLLRIWKEHAAGEDYPDDFSHISFVTLEDLRGLAAGAWAVARVEVC